MSSRPHILALDILRGFFILVVFIDHLYRFPNFFEIFTGRGELWVSAAEGFFIISGILVGYLKSSRPKLWKRALKLYLLSIALTLFFTLWGNFLPLELIKVGLWNGPIGLSFWVKTFTFQYIYGWADFLAFYAVYLFIAPLVLKFNYKVILVISFFTWLLFRNSSSFFAWQLLFFTGLVIGRNLLIFENKIKKNITILNLITTATILSSVYFVFIHKTNLSVFWFGKDNLGPVRFILAICWFATLYSHVREREQFVNKLTFKILSFSGQNSLYIYCLEALIVFPINYLFKIQFDYLGNTLFTLLGCVLIYLLTLFIKPTLDLKK